MFYIAYLLLRSFGLRLRIYEMIFFVSARSIQKSESVTQRICEFRYGLDLPRLCF